MTNAQKIKELEKELGRYRKRAADDGATIKRLRTQLKGAEELGRAVDAVLAVAAVRFGEQITDEDGGVLGCRLELPPVKVDEVLHCWEVRARKDESGALIVGVAKRDAE